MKIPRKTLGIVGAIVAVVLVAMLVIPMVVKGPLVTRVKAEVNQAVDARVEWSGIGLGFFRDFPNLTFRLDNLTVRGNGRFQADTLARVRDFRLVLDLGSVVRNLRKRGPVEIRSVVVNQTALRLIVLEDGTANWNIMKPRPAPAAGSSRPFEVGLRGLEINDASVAFDNRKSGVFAAIAGLRHTLDGDFTRERFDLRTRTHADSLTLRFAGVPYLNQVALDVTAELGADLAKKQFTFKQNEVRLNDLRLGFSGQVAKAGEDLALDLTFRAPSNEFRHILSLVPAVYAKDFQSLQTSGAVAVEGKVAGRYGKTAFPSFAVRARVDNAQFRYPDLPLPARNIRLDLAIDNPGMSLDSTVVNLRRFHAEIGSDPVDASLLLRTPLSDPELDLRVKGKVDLASLSRTVKLERTTELAGAVAADLSVHTRMSAIDNRQYERIAASGNATVTNVTVRTADLPHAVKISEMQLGLSPRQAELRSFSGSIGSSDLRLAGTLDNLLGFVLRDQDLRGTATLNSRFFDLNEWQSKKDSLKVIPVPPRIDFTLTAAIEKLKYGRLELANTRGKVRLADQRITLDDLQMSMLGGTMAMRGYYDTKDLAKPLFDMNLTVADVNIPDAFRALTTVQMLAPIARYAQGRVSTELSLNGTLGKNMMPLFNALSGRGLLRTTSLALQDFPPMNRLSDALKLELLKNPTLQATRSSFDIRDGRLYVKPFDVKVGSSTMTIAGWNGIDQSLDYTLALAVPRSALGADANRIVNDLIAKAGRTGVNLQAADVVQLGIQLTGSITNPSIKTGFGNALASVGNQVTATARELVEQKAAEVTERVDSAREEARRKARAEADRLISAAEERAATVRAEAQKLADAVKKEGEERADTLQAKATSPLARAAARPAADRLRREAANRSDQIVKEANQRADAIVAEARKRAAELVGDTTTVPPPRSPE